MLQRSRYQLERDAPYDIAYLNRSIFRSKINTRRVPLSPRVASSGPALRHEVKETAIGRRCARERKGGDTASATSEKGAKGERK